MSYLQTMFMTLIYPSAFEPWETVHTYIVYPVPICILWCQIKSNNKVPLPKRTRW